MRKTALDLHPTDINAESDLAWRSVINRIFITASRDDRNAGFIRVLNIRPLLWKFSEVCRKIGEDLRTQRLLEFASGRTRYLMIFAAFSLLSGKFGYPVWL